MNAVDAVVVGEPVLAVVVPTKIPRAELHREGASTQSHRWSHFEFDPEPSALTGRSRASSVGPFRVFFVDIASRQ